MEEVKSNIGNSVVPLVIVGNKKDLQDERMIQTEEGQELAETYSAYFFETSAKDETD